MTKIEKEIPVVSPELAKQFGDNDKKFFYPCEIVDSDIYLDVPEFEDLDIPEFEKLLIDMYSLGYEVKKPKLYYLVFNFLKGIHVKDAKGALCLNKFRYRHKNKYTLYTNEGNNGRQTQFTQAEIDEMKDEINLSAFEKVEVQDD